MSRQSPTGDINALYENHRAGDKAAYKRLLEQLSVSFRVIARHKLQSEDLAEEIAQEALIVVVENIESLKVEHSFAAWAYRVLTNKIVDYVRVEGNRRRLLAENPETVKPNNPAGPDPRLRTRLIDCLRRISRDNRRHARVLNFSYQGFRATEICNRLKISRNYLYVLLSRARGALEQCLARGADEL